jgi:hypothetical protein
LILHSTNDFVEFGFVRGDRVGGCQVAEIVSDSKPPRRALDWPPSR